MAVLDLQRRSQQIGRIRTGIQEQASNGRMRPAKLDRLRFTSPSRTAIESVAALYGGEAQPWKNGHRDEWEVITGTAEIGITVPPRDAVITHWYELWGRGGCQRRCDSQREQISGGPCLCPHAGDPRDPEAVERAALERADLAKQGKACHLITRINVMIPDLPGLGVWRLDTGSFYAAGETIDQASLMEMARDRGVFLPAILRLEQRQRVAGGETRNYAVPVIDVLATARQIVTGQLEGQGLAAQLPPAPGEQPKAIESGQPAPEKSIPVPRQASGRSRKPRTAQDVADDAASATTREEIEALSGEMKRLEWEQDYVYPDLNPDGVHDELQNILRDKWRKLPAGGGD